MSLYFLNIGPARSGTTSLYYMLSLINNKVVESKILNQMIIKDFNVIDKEYGTQLNEIYFR